MIFVTGDTHGSIDSGKLSSSSLEKLTKNDYLIICGDFGFVWYGDNRDDKYLNWLESLPYTVLFVDGNHENFDALNTYKIELWHGGHVQFIRPHVIHLMRGEIFNIENKTFFSFGGAKSTDKMYRQEHISWWEQEMPSDAEYDNAFYNLDRVHWKVDYVITHATSDTILGKIAPYYKHDKLTNFLHVIDSKLEYKKWYFGHYHLDDDVDRKHTLLYDKVCVVGEDI